MVRFSGASIAIWVPFVLFTSLFTWLTLSFLNLQLITNQAVYPLHLEEAKIRAEINYLTADKGKAEGTLKGWKGNLIPAQQVSVPALISDQRGCKPAEASEAKGWGEWANVAAEVPLGYKHPQAWCPSLPGLGVTVPVTSRAHKTQWVPCQPHLWVPVSPAEQGRGLVKPVWPFIAGGGEEGGLKNKLISPRGFQGLRISYWLWSEIHP